MSTEDERREVPAVPRTRAELRAAREEAERAAAARAAVDPGEAAEGDAAARAAAEDEAAGRAPADRAVAARAAARASADPAREHANTPGADTPDVGPIAPERPTSGVSAPEAGEHEAHAGDAGAHPGHAGGRAGHARADPGHAGAHAGHAGAHAGHARAHARPADAAAREPRDRRFLLALGAVLGILVLIGAGLGAVSLTQGPRITDVQVDPEQAIEASGSRLILTANQSLATVDESQVSVEPAVPFTVDASGRGVGIRFTVPLDDDTKYTVRIAGATGAGGGPAADLTTSFRTPASSLFLLRRDAEGEDMIFRTDLSGEGVPVFAADKINDFRATSDRLVVSVEEDEGSKLLVMDEDGTDQRELELPGEGYVGAIQVSDRGGLVGYSYSDKELSDTEGRASVLVTQSLSGEDEPVVAEVGGEEASIFVWQFVPDSSAMLFIDFDGALSLVDRSTDAGVQSLGLATTIQGISRGTYTAIVERLDGTVVRLNLADGSEEPLEASDPDYGRATTITPFPGGTLRHIVARDADEVPIGQAIIRVDDAGTATPLVEVGPTDSILQACASPSGQYAAVVIAPQVADNPYDQMLLPLPQNLETHLIDLETGKELVALTGFDASWCQTAPKF